jgi:hypothetical protein
MLRTYHALGTERHAPGTERISDRARRAFNRAFENDVLWNPQILQILDKATRR